MNVFNLLNLFKKPNNDEKSENTENKQNAENPNNPVIAMRLLEQELDDKFPDYNIMESFGFDECFSFMYRNIKDLQNTLIIAAVLRQIEVPIEEVAEAYGVTEEYVSNVIQEQIPRLRVLANQRLESLPNEEYAFFPGMRPNFEPLYKELIARMDYLFEVRRNTKKLLTEIPYFPSLTRNSAFLFLLNYLPARDALIVASSLNILDLDEDAIQRLYPFDTEYFESVLNRCVNLMRKELQERIGALEETELETSYFDYPELCSEYKDLLQRIDDTLAYLKNKPKRG